MNPRLNWQPDPEHDTFVVRVGHLILSAWEMDAAIGGGFNYNVTAADVFSGEQASLVAPTTGRIETIEDAQVQAEAAARRLVQDAYSAGLASGLLETS